MADVIAMFVMADVIAIMFYIGWCYCQFMLWLMLLPLCFILADVIANYLMAGVIAIMFLLLADVIANCVMWDIVPHLYCVCGRCYDHFVHG